MAEYGGLKGQVIPKDSRSKRLMRYKMRVVDPRLPDFRVFIKIFLNIIEVAEEITDVDYNSRQYQFGRRFDRADVVDTFF